MTEWKPGELVANLFDDLPPDLDQEEPPALPPPLPVGKRSPPPATQGLWAMPAGKVADPAAAKFMKKERQIYIVGYPIAVIFLLLASHFASTTESYSGFSLAVCVLLSASAVILAFVNWMAIHHHLWKLIPPALAVTSPARALGFFFIPLFNVYWCFVTFKGLATAANKTLVALKEPTVRCNENLALAFSITQSLALCAGAVVPLLGLLAAVSAYVL